MFFPLKFNFKSSGEKSLKLKTRNTYTKITAEIAIKLIIIVNKRKLGISNFIINRLQELGWFNTRFYRTIRKLCNMKKFLKKLTIFDYYVGFLTILNLLPFIAPLLLKLGLVFPAKIIYFIFSFTCHQFASRSIHIYDFQYAWCARDTGIWLGIVVVAWLLRARKLTPIRWYWVIPFMIPIALDGGLQTIFTFLNITPAGDLAGGAIYASNNLARFITGSIFGVGLSLWLSGSLLPENVQQELKEKRNDKTENWKIFGLITVLFVVYFAAVSLWNLTSTKYNPSDILDSSVKIQNENFFARRENGICATESMEDLFQFECFFGK